MEVRVWWRALHNGDDHVLRKACALDDASRSGRPQRGRGSKAAEEVAPVWDFPEDQAQWRADVASSKTLNAVAYHAWVLSDRAAPLLNSVSRGYVHRLRIEHAMQPTPSKKGKGSKARQAESDSDDGEGEAKFARETSVPERFQLALGDDEDSDSAAAHYLIRHFVMRDKDASVPRVLARPPPSAVRCFR